jgi:sigma-E factor negative regulatory protein RseC
MYPTYPILIVLNRDANAMLEECGVVVKVADEFAWIQTSRHSACGHCDSKSSCGTASLSQVLGQKKTEIRVINHLAVRVGDNVVVGLEEQALLRGSLVIYLLPLLCLFATAILAQTWFHSEQLTILSGIIGLAGGLLWVKRITAKMADDVRYQPVILRII